MIFLDNTEILFDGALKFLNKRVGGFMNGKRLATWALLGQMNICLAKQQGKDARVVLNYHNYKPRLHLMVVRASGTGKTELLRAITELGKGLDLYSFSVGEVTEATSKSLVGGIERIIDGKGNIVKEWANYGSFDKAMILFPETQTLIETTGLWGKISGMLLNALDNYGHVLSTSYSDIWRSGNKIGERFSYYTTSSILSSSTFRASMRREVISSGLLQRFLFDFKEFNKKDFQENRQAKRETIMNSAQDTEKLMQGQMSFTELRYQEINELKNFIENIKIEPFVRFDSNDLKKFDKFEEEIINNYEKDYPEFDESTNTFETFSNRLEIYTRIMAASKTMFDGRQIVNYDDLQFAFNDAQFCYKSIIDFINTTNLQGELRREEKLNDTIIQELDKPPWLFTRNEFKNILKKLKSTGKLRISNNQAGKIVSGLISSGILDEHSGMKFNKKFYSLSKNNHLLEEKSFIKKNKKFAF